MLLEKKNFQLLDCKIVKLNIFTTFVKLENRNVIRKKKFSIVRL